MTVATAAPPVNPAPAEAIVQVQAADASARVISVFVDAYSAKRSVTGWVTGEVANMMRGDAPVLVVEPARAFWRVPVVLTSRAGVVGEVGTVVVDAQTGELETSEAIAQQFVEAARQLVSKNTGASNAAAPRPA